MVFRIKVSYKMIIQSCKLLIKSQHQNDNCKLLKICKHKKGQLLHKNTGQLIKINNQNCLLFFLLNKY